LRRAVEELSWLLGRGYALQAATTLVGDHHQLHRRQQRAIQRCACAPQAAAARRRARVAPDGQRLAIDGFNLVITVEAALSGGILLRGRDDRVRDLASVHGNYRRVAETQRAIDLLLEASATAAEALWVLDRPVSNSGRLAAMLRDRGAAVELSSTADGRLVELCTEGAALASSDGPLMDRVLRAAPPGRPARLVDLLARPLADMGTPILDLAG
ncbi:MAG: DUF434 domain-containing protein, partial [Deltaproteobacteria bacterium]